MFFHVQRLEECWDDDLGYLDCHAISLQFVCLCPNKQRSVEAFVCLALVSERLQSFLFRFLYLSQ